MLLDKWYLDLVTDEGLTVISYAATARVAGLRVGYSAELVAPRGQRASERWRWRSEPPRRESDGLSWRCPGLSVHGLWRGQAPAISVRLLDCAAGGIQWRVVQPRAAAAIRLDDGRTFRGTGYVERLRLTLPPWRLPFDELRWGRFHGETSTLVWIDWRGGMRRQWAYLDGHPVEEISIDDRHVHAGGARLDLTASAILRDAPLLNVLGRWRTAGRLMAPSQARSHETKWLSRGELRRADGRTDHGWGIHEVVRWR